MKLYFLLIISLFSIVISCNPRGKGIDKNDIINRETMIRLMADMQITEAALRQKQSALDHDTMKIITAKAYDSLYLFYKTTPKAFQVSLKYYQQDLEKYLKMNEEMITILSQKQDSIKLEKDTANTNGKEKEVKIEVDPGTGDNKVPVGEKKDLKTTIDKPQIKQPEKKQSVTKEPEKVVIDINRKPPLRK